MAFNDVTRNLSARKSAGISLREFYALCDREPEPGTADHILWMADMEEAYGRLSQSDLEIVGDFSMKP
jgi:hypothetical protein